jgi:hypothetical protein
MRWVNRTKNDRWKMRLFLVIFALLFSGIRLLGLLTPSPRPPLPPGAAWRRSVRVAANGCNENSKISLEDLPKPPLASANYLGGRAGFENFRST